MAENPPIRQKVIIEAVAQIDTSQLLSQMGKAQRAMAGKLGTSAGLVGQAVKRVQARGPGGRFASKKIEVDAIAGAKALRNQGRALAALAQTGQLSDRKLYSFVGRLKEFNRQVQTSGQALPAGIKNLNRWVAGVEKNISVLGGLAKAEKILRGRMYAPGSALEKDILQADTSLAQKVAKNNARQRAKSFNVFQKAQKAELKQQDAGRRSEANAEWAWDREGERRGKRTRRQQQQVDAQIFAQDKQAGRETLARSRKLLREVERDEAALTGGKASRWNAIWKRRTGAMSNIMEQFSSAGAGYMAGLSALQGNMMGLGFSLIFARFSSVPTMAAFTGLTLVIGGLIEAIKRTDSVKTLGLQLEGLTGSIQTAKEMTDLATLSARTYGDSIEEAGKTVGAFRKMGGPVTPQRYATAVGMGLVTGEGTAAAAERMRQDILQYKSMIRTRAAFKERREFLARIGEEYGMETKGITAPEQLEAAMAAKFAPMAPRKLETLGGAGGRFAEVGRATISNLFGGEAGQKASVDFMNNWTRVLEQGDWGGALENIMQTAFFIGQGGRGLNKMLDNWRDWSGDTKKTISSTYKSVLDTTDRYIGSSLIPDSLRVGLEEMVTTARNWVIPFTDPFRDIWLKIMQRFNIGTDRVSSLWNRMKDLTRSGITFAINFVAQGVQTAWEWLQNASGSAVTLTIDLIGTWVQVAIDAVKDTWSWLSDAAGRAVELTLRFLGDVAKLAIDAVKDAWGWLQNAAQTAVNLSLNFLGEVAKLAIESAKGTWTWIQDAGKTVVNLSLSFLGDAAKVTIEAVKDTWTWIQGAGTTVVNLSLTFLGDLAKNAIESIKNTWTWLQDAAKTNVLLNLYLINQSIAIILSSIQSAWGWLSSKASQAINLTMSLLGNAYDFISSIVDWRALLDGSTAQVTLSAIWKGILSAAGQIGPSWMELGTQWSGFINKGWLDLFGLWAGVTSAVGESWTNFVAAWDSLRNNASVALSTVWNGVTGLGADALSSMISAWVWLKDNAGLTLSLTLSNAFQAVMNTVTGLLDQAIGLINNITSNLRQAFPSWASGLGFIPTFNAPALAFPFSTAENFVTSFEAILKRSPNLQGTEETKLESLKNWWSAFQSTGGNYNGKAGTVGFMEWGNAIRLFAQGGIVTRPVSGIVGEAGPEAIIPLKAAGAQGLLGTNINISIDLAGAVISNAQTVRELASLVGDQIVQELRLRRPNIIMSGI